MSRHSKNNTGSSVFTYGEREKLKNSNEWGEISLRLGSDSQKKFEQCNLCLNINTAPVICPKGHIYCKECILENLLFQKKKNKKNISEWNEANKINDQEAKANDCLIKMAQLIQIEESCNSNQPSSIMKKKPSITTTTHTPIFTNIKKEDIKKTSNCFWLPEQTPSNKDNKKTKPKE